MRACLYLLLVGKGVELFFELLVGDVNYGELLSVVAGGGIAYGFVYEVELLRGYRFPLVAAYAASVEQGFVDCFHYNIWCVGFF